MGVQCLQVATDGQDDSSDRTMVVTTGVIESRYCATRPALAFHFAYICSRLDMDYRKERYVLGPIDARTTLTK